MPWILSAGAWNDDGVWDDSDVWNDGATTTVISDLGNNPTMGGTTFLTGGINSTPQGTHFL